MEELAAGIRELHERVASLDSLLKIDARARDLSERMGVAASVQAEEASRLARVAHDLSRRMTVVVAFALVIWTPVVAYGAVWFHELVRNTCYQSATQVDEAWYCGIFPGTGHHRAH